MQTSYVLFADGGATPNPGDGAAAWCIRDASGNIQEGARFVPDTTNNRMELLAVIEGLRRIPVGTSVCICVDSQYVQKGMCEWIHNWKKNFWKTAAKKDVLNRDLWEQLDALCNERCVRWHWVKGHSGHPENERCDALVQEAKKRRQDIGAG